MQNRLWKNETIGCETKLSEVLGSGLLDKSNPGNDTSDPLSFQSEPEPVSTTTKMAKKVRKALKVCVKMKCKSKEGRVTTFLKSECLSELYVLGYRQLTPVATLIIFKKVVE